MTPRARAKSLEHIVAKFLKEFGRNGVDINCWKYAIMGLYEPLITEAVEAETKRIEDLIEEQILIVDYEEQLLWGRLLGAIRGEK